MKTLSSFVDHIEFRRAQLSKCRKANAKLLRIGKRFPSALADPCIPKYITGRYTNGDPVAKVVSLRWFAHDDHILVCPYDTRHNWTEDKLAFATIQEVERFAKHLSAQLASGN